MDKFRILITEIGNTLGYVRMVRSAGMHVCSEAVQFIPDLQNVMRFAPFAGDGEGDDLDNDAKEVAAHLSPETVAAAKNLDSVVGNLTERLQEESDFLKVCVCVCVYVEGVVLFLVLTLVAVWMLLWARSWWAWFVTRWTRPTTRTWPTST